MGEALIFRAVHKSFAGPASVEKVVDGVDLTIDEGEFVSLIGPSGCGKSTLLRLACGLAQPDAGSVDGVARTRGDTAFVFQDPHLLPWRTVTENVELPLEFVRLSADERRERVHEALAAVELDDVGHRYPAELSGGMRMRASIARALVTRPRLLLMDEPFAALDELTRQRLDERLRALWLARRYTVLFVTHSIVEATFLAERALVFSRRPARVVLDMRIALPPQRSAPLRTEPAFAAQAGKLLAALEDGST